nr:MAG TPA: hypothetical protein [Caudoviricetes sp.]DAM31194.1 MAG TPA: hypothetical protein [Caudoviricetes sp.]
MCFYSKNKNRFTAYIRLFYKVFYAYMLIYIVLFSYS